MAQKQTRGAGAPADRFFAAAITPQQAQQIEAKEDADWQPRRRVALGVLQKTSAELAALGPVAISEMFSLVDEWDGHLSSCAELADDARSRLLLAAHIKGGA